MTANRSSNIWSRFRQQSCQFDGDDAAVLFVADTELRNVISSKRRLCHENAPVVVAAATRLSAVKKDRYHQNHCLRTTKCGIRTYRINLVKNAKKQNLHDGGGCTWARIARPKRRVRGSSEPQRMHLQQSRTMSTCLEKEQIVEEAHMQ